MRRSTARGSLAIAVVGFLCLAAPAPASAGGEDPERPHTRLITLYGAYLPDRVQWDDARWGFGLVTRTALGPRWGIAVGAARFAGPDESVVPVTGGVTYGPESRSGLRPWAELGVGYYRLESQSMVARVYPAAISAGGYYGFAVERSRALPRHEVGGYFGLGFDLPLSHRFALGTGVRIHGWSGPDALLALQSGLSFGF